MFFDIDQNRMIDLTRVISITRFFIESHAIWGVAFSLDSESTMTIEFSDETNCALFWDSIPRITDEEK